jgi:hypothetical protein
VRTVIVGGKRERLNDTLALVRWPSEWEALEEMQDFARHFFRRHFSSDLADRGRIAANELFENACRYATAGHHVAIEIRGDSTGFTLRVTNEAVEARVALLRKRIADIAGGDATASYHRALRRLLDENSDVGAGAGLGLLRARVEAAVDLELEQEGRRITVIATSGAGQSRPRYGATPRARPA